MKQASWPMSAAKYSGRSLALACGLRRPALERAPFDRAVVVETVLVDLALGGTLGPGELDGPTAQAVGRSYLVGSELVAVHGRIATDLYTRQVVAPPIFV
jgi:hypothetical protein